MFGERNAEGGGVRGGILIGVGSKFVVSKEVVNHKIPAKKCRIQ